MPKFIQITSAGVANTSQTQCNYVLHALTDDGRIFQISDKHGWVEFALPWEKDTLVITEGMHPNCVPPCPICEE